jgi:ribonuclease G
LPEWLIERGIGETRSALVEDGDIIEARIELDGVRRAGSVISARLRNIGTGGRNAVAVGGGGNEYLLPRGAGTATLGSTLVMEVTREAIPGAEPWKRALARLSEKEPQEPEPISGREVTFPSPTDRLGEAGWNDLIDQARTGTVIFAGGELRISPTPAMTLIDVDGYLPPKELAVLGATEAALAIRRLDIGGSIGIDLPTTARRTARQRADAAIDDALPQPFERTAVNGFGFVQIVRPRSRASVIELAQDKAGFEARVLLRNAAMDSPGPKRLVAAPAVIALLQRHPDWLHALARQVGGAVELRADTALPMSGGYAENL